MLTAVAYYTLFAAVGLGLSVLAGWVMNLVLRRRYRR